MKVFLSHSSLQKSFVRSVADYLGRDVAIVDEYVFESGRDIWSEIRSSIETCDIFVFMITRYALKSDWVRDEITYVRRLVDREKVSFLAYILDDTQPTDDDIEPWIQKIILNKFISPRLVARNIKREISNLCLKRHQVNDYHGYLFEGRDNEMARLRTLINHTEQESLRALIVSGLPCSGRKRLLRQVINIHLRPDQDLKYHPIYLKLDADDSLPEVIGILNDYTSLYTRDELIGKLQTKDDMLEAAAHQFNTLMKARERVVIDDNGAIVLRNGHIVDWFVDMLRNADLSSQIHLFVAAKNAITARVGNAMPVVSQRISTLDKDAMRSLLHAYCRLTGTEVRNENEDEYLDAFKGYPDVLYHTVDILKSEGVASAKKYMQGASGIHEHEIGESVARFREEPVSFALLVLLSRFEFISFATLVDIFGEKEETVINILDDFNRAGICEVFGKQCDYYRLVPPVRDYVTRNKLQLPGKYNSRLRSRLLQYVSALETGEDATSDFGTTLMSVKELVKQKGVSRLTDKLLLPTFVLKVIMEEYNAGNYDSVITLARKALYDYHHNNYESQLTPIRYWMCLAMARRNNDDVIKESEQLNHYKCHFVRGFYYSCLKTPDYAKAAGEYKEALRDAFSYERLDGIKAKHQLVVCYQKMGQYDKAVSLARECSDSDPSNAYYLQAYFECLLKSRERDPKIMSGLIDRMRHLHEASSQAVASGMDAQLSYFVYGNYSVAKNTLRIAIENEGDNKIREMLFRILKEITNAANDRQTYDQMRREFV